MTAEQHILEELARLIAPAGADVRHLCAAGTGTFSIERPGVGGSDVVYALKVVKEPQHGAARSATEFSALLEIDDPNVVRYRDTGTRRHGSDEYRWLAMDFVDGSSVAQLLADGVVFDSPTAVRLLREAVSGAAALWNVGTTHRHLAADNVIITPSGGVVIVDLGLSEVDGSHRTTSAHPSRASEIGPRDWRADQFALGLLGYQVATGAEPFVLHEGHPERPTDHQPTAPPAHHVHGAVPPKLSDVLATMLASRPEDRYTDPDALQADLASIADAAGAGVQPFPMLSQEGVCHRNL